MAWSTRPDPLARAGLFVVALVSALSIFGLDRLPLAFGGDEAQFAVHAESIARSGRDLNGTAFPVFVRIADPLVPNHTSGIWYQPLLFYAIAPFVKVFGVTEWSVRLPVALLAVLDIWLLYAVARRMFRDRRFGLAAAAMLMLTPAHIIVSRQALDYVAPLPFVLGWLLLLLRYLDTGQTRSLALAGFLIGAGLFSYIAAWVLMPIYLAFTAVAIWRSPWPWRPALVACCAGFAVPALALVAALGSNQEMLANTISRYEVGGAVAARPGLAERAALYWDYFNPSFLFLAGGSNPTQATSRVGVFLIALLPLIAVGLREIWIARSGRGMIAAAAFLVAPLPIALTMPPAAGYSIARAMTLVPFGILIALYGLRAMLSDRRLRTVAIVLLISIPLQFTQFARDYRGDYQFRAAPRLDPGNVSAVADAVIGHDAHTPIPAIYLSDRIDDGGVRWRFFMLKLRRLDLWTKSRSINLAQTKPALEPGALVVCYASEPDVAGFVKSGYAVIAEVRGIAGEPAAVVLKAPG